MHVVVVGGGFGGVKAALELSKRHIGKITLITDRPYFLHHATLYATATGKSTEESVIPLHLIFQHHPDVDIVEDFITSLDPHRKLVSSKTKDYHYDKLIMSLGSTTDFFGIAGLEKHSFGIKTLEEVREFQDHIHDSVVKEKLDKEYFVIGAGLTGVEVAGALNEHLKILKMLYRLKGAAPKVTLVEMADRILPRMSRTASHKVAAQLKKQGVKIILNEKVTALKNDSITVGGRIYPTSTAIWTSGTINNPFYSKHREYFSLNAIGDVEVNPYLEALQDVYVIGDNNDVKCGSTALSAMRQATHVAKNMARIATKRPRKRFVPRRAPIGIPLNSTWGYVEWFGIYAAGRTGLVLRRWMELYGYTRLVPLKVALPIWRSHSVRDVDDIY